MIVKMKFINISGPRNDIDRVTDQYLSRYEIQLESALSELKTVDNLRPFVELNPYREVLSKANEFVGYLPNAETVEPDTKLGLDDMFELVRKADEDYRTLQEKKEKLKQKIEEYRAKQQIVAPFRPLECDLHRVLHYRYITYRFGRIAVEFYHKMQKYLMDDLKAIFVEGERDESYVYGVYFVSQAETQKVDAVFRSLHFERIELKDEFEGTPDTAYRVLENEIARVNLEIEDLDKQAGEMLADRAPQLVAARDRLEELSNNFDVRKLAARMEDKQEDYYILCGWMAEDDVDKFVEEVKEDDKVFVVVEDDHDAYFGEPPTKLENPKLFKPFEMYIQMYGLPAHNEMDPTIFVAITYSFIFGVMFGDVGQGLLLAIGGLILYKVKNMDLAAIIGCAGVFSTIFGFMYGSFFGFEDLIPALWLKPSEAMLLIPGLGNMNTVFVVAIVFGMFLILLTMIFNIINAVRSRDIENIIFSQNAICGLVFYGALTVTILLYITGHALPATVVLVVMFVIPLILIMLKEPLTRIVEKKTPAIEGGKAMYFVQSFFELFEVMLSYLSNTLSFVRVGAFAVSHAAMMGVVLMLAGAESGGSINWLIIILGNAFVCAMEGLIVGIQVLRLEYYEMFSRFYKGSGREFKPFLKNVKTNH